MIVRPIRITEDQGITTLSADFIFSRPFGPVWNNRNFYLKRLIKGLVDPVFFLRHRFSIAYPVWVSLPSSSVASQDGSDAFFIIAVVMAIATNQSLSFASAVSPEVLGKVASLEKYYRFEHPPRTIHIEATPKKKRQKKRLHEAGLFFTLGVDSFYSLLSSPIQQEKTPRHLIYVDGFDVPLHQTSFLQDIHTKIEHTAYETKKTPLFIQTNLRNLAERTMNWGQFHVAALAAIGFLLPYREIAISGESFDWPDWGLRFGVDALFSTSTVSFQLIGHHLSRYQKMKALQRSAFFPLVLRHLRVCWINVDSHHIRYNCSRCQKCLKTMLVLRILGIKKPPTFQSFKRSTLRNIELVGHVRQEWTELYSLILKMPTLGKALRTDLMEVLNKPLRT